jgi:ubiquinone/menaquinone biosynthesis C-methylase UbiE
MSYLLRTIHKAASVGWVYDLIQFVAGSPISKRRLRALLSRFHGRVLDVGGGTGAVAELLPSDCFCTCLDNEMPKLSRCAESGRATPLLADATRMPIQSDSIDVVTCIAMTHHLTDAQLVAVLSESNRVLKPRGALIFLDPVLKPSRLPGRVLWALDRGSHPRSSSTLREAVERQFRIERWDRFAVFHDYVIAVCEKTESMGR